MIERVSCAPSSRAALQRVADWLGADVTVPPRPDPDALEVGPELSSNPLELDEELYRLDADGGRVSLHLEGGAEPSAFFEHVLTRYQRWLPFRRGTDSGVAKALPEHRRMFDCEKPLVRADLAHALDTWRWCLRLDLGASRALQLAALFHDVERLTSEPDRRVEHLAPSYADFKREHARIGARTAREILVGCGLPAAVVTRTVELIERHEAPADDEELAALNDADALSFFSLNSWGFFEYFGEGHTRKKVSFTLNRMRASARRYLPRLHCHPRVKTLLSDALERAHGGDR